MMPRWRSAASAFTSGTTRGTPGFHAERGELLHHLHAPGAPPSAQSGATRHPRPRTARSVDARKTVLGEFLDWDTSPRNSRARPAERAEANSRSRDRGKSRSSRQPISSLPTAPVEQYVRVSGHKKKISSPVASDVRGRGTLRVKGVTPRFPKRSSSGSVAGGERAATRWAGGSIDGRSGISSAAKGESARPPAAALAVQEARTPAYLLGLHGSRLVTRRRARCDRRQQPAAGSPGRPSLRGEPRRCRRVARPGCRHGAISCRPLRSAATYLGRRRTWLSAATSLPGLDEIVGLLAVVRMAATTELRHGRSSRSAPTGHGAFGCSMPPAYLDLTGAARLFDRLQAHHREVVSAVRGRAHGRRRRISRSSSWEQDESRAAQDAAGHCTVTECRG